MSINAFLPQGNTVTFTGATSAPTAVQAVGNNAGATQYEICNLGIVTVFMGFGLTAASATAGAVTSAFLNTLVLPAGCDKVYTLAANCFFTGITSSSTAVVTITPGDGL